MSRNNRSRFPHASTSTCNHACGKSGFARRDTEFRLIEGLRLVRWRSWRGRIYVEEQAHGGADHYCAEAGRLLLRKR
jgi:hypothetical protein